RQLFGGRQIDRGKEEGLETGRFDFDRIFAGRHAVEDKISVIIDSGTAFDACVVIDESDLGGRHGGATQILDDTADRTCDGLAQAGCLKQTCQKARGNGCTGPERGHFLFSFARTASIRDFRSCLATPTVYTRLAGVGVRMTPKKTLSSPS